MVAQIKTFEPIYLYRYRPLAREEFYEREISAVRDDFLWCSNFLSLNDPMEGSYRGSPNLRNHGRYQFVRDKIFDQKNALGICSFSETHDNGPMWAHYSDQFQGICIAYNFRVLRESIPDECSFVRLSYEEDPYLVTQARVSEGEEVAQRILSSKSHRWLYEREWRLFCAASGKLNLERRCISRVYLGNRMDEQRRTNLLKVLADEHIEAHAMELDGYKLSFRNIKAGKFTTRPGLEDEVD